MQIMEAIQQAALNLFVVAIIALLGYVAKQAGSFLKEKGLLDELQSKKAYAEIVVRAVEQMYKEADGDVKFDGAKGQLVAILQNKGFNVKDGDIDSLIEAAVHSVKGGFQEGSSDEEEDTQEGIEEVGEDEELPDGPEFDFDDPEEEEEIEESKDSEEESDEDPEEEDTDNEKEGE